MNETALKMKPETIARRAKAFAAERASRHAEQRARIVDCIKRNEARGIFDSIFADMVAEMDAAECNYVGCTLHERNRMASA